MTSPFSGTPPSEPMTNPPAISLPPFTEFASIARLSRDVIVTEKIDGTNAQVHITDDGRILVGSRTRWVPEGQSHFGFEKWVAANADTLRLLGPGSHFGEWWGSGVQRGYGLTNGEKRFSLFNVGRWSAVDEASGDYRCKEIPCCHVVPVLLRWTFDTAKIDAVLADLDANGSKAAPGFMKPEGIVVYHTKSQTLFKKTLDKNDGHKGQP